MKIIEFKGLVASATGKLYKGSNCYIRRNRYTGAHVGVTRVENYQHSRSAEQAEIRREFGEASRAACRWRKANPPGSPEYERVMAIFERQVACWKFDAFLVAHPELIGA